MTSLSLNMRTALYEISKGRSAHAALAGRGRNVDATLVALGKRKLLRFGRSGGTMGWEITDAGRALAASWECAACGHTDYHCPASGCNHTRMERDDLGDHEVWCDCETFVPRTPPPISKGQP